MGLKFDLFQKAVLGIVVASSITGCSGVGDATFSSEVTGSGGPTGSGSGNGSGPMCVESTLPHFIGSETDRYVVSGESLRVMGRGRYRFPASATQGSMFSFKFYATEGQKFLLGTVVTVGTGLRWDVSISSCPGDYEVPRECQASSVEVSMPHLLAGPFATEPPVYYCKLEPNKPYYLNVKLPLDRSFCSDVCDFYVNGLPISQYIWD